ncbi:guanidinoacetate N-methyltransferase [Papio anubis]|uniref:guanidinoacetate N-methyltransferase n=1 Tax=Papio anubis TaxID=9555 RepID=UPI0012AD6B04|nr:guanidinoacetate N-methyltransferase [Papio anubis]
MMKLLTVTADSRQMALQLRTQVSKSTPTTTSITAFTTSKGGRVLDVGFGMATRTWKVQEVSNQEHWIMEHNDSIFQWLQDWAQPDTHTSSTSSRTPLFTC